MKDDSHRIALFIDFDNIEKGVRTSLGQHFKISVLLEALKEKGIIISKRAYGDWQRFPMFARELSENGVEMVQRVTNYSGDKNGADINIAVDAMELALTNEHIDIFAIASGDSDFLPLITRLKLQNKLVYVIGGLTFTSASILKNCTEFIAYENLIGIPEMETNASPRRSRNVPISNVFPTLRRAIDILEERGVTATSGALKSCMLQLDPTFDERTYGISTFSNFLRMVEKQGFIRLATPPSGGGYLVSLVSPGSGSPAQKSEKQEPSDQGSKPQGDADTALEFLHKTLARISESGGRRYVPASFFKRQVLEVEPGFDERDYGFDRFSTLLKFAKRKGILNMARGKKEAMVAPVVRPDEPASGEEKPLGDEATSVAMNREPSSWPSEAMPMEAGGLTGHEDLPLETEPPPQREAALEPDVFPETASRQPEAIEEATSKWAEESEPAPGRAPRKRAASGTRRSAQRAKTVRSRAGKETARRRR